MRRKKTVALLILLLAVVSIFVSYFYYEIFGFYPLEIRKFNLARQIKNRIEKSEATEIDIKIMGNVDEWNEIAVIPAYQVACNLKIKDLSDCESHSPTNDNDCLLLFLKDNQFQFEILTTMNWDICKDDKEKRIPRELFILRR